MSEITIVLEPTQNDHLDDHDVKDGKDLKPRPPMKRNAFEVLMAQSKKPKQDATPPQPHVKRNAFEVMMAESKKPKQVAKPQPSFPSASYTFPLPFYKVVHGTSIVVDGFSYKPSTYPQGCQLFLSHAHSDHYHGLTPEFLASFPETTCVWGSSTTLSMMMLITPSLKKVPGARFRSLRFGEVTGVAGCRVTLLPANHCPGAAQVLVSPSPSVHHLHTGDFRWDPKLMGPLLAGTRIDKLFLDTTFVAEKHSFPPQGTVIAAVVERIALEVARHPRVVVLFGAYTVGKERIAAAVARSLGLTVQVDPFKRSLLECITADDELDTRDYADIFKVQPSPLRLVSMGDLNVAGMRRIAVEERCGRVLAVIPTGWEHEKSKGELIRVEESAKGPSTAKIHVAYSEHSSFTELRDCVEQLRPRQIVPTVGVKTSEDARLMVERLCQRKT